MLYLLVTCLLSIFILALFYMFSFSNLVLTMSQSPFECGYTSFSSSLFSFSIHYLLFVFLFLLLDLEFSLTFWFFYSSCFSSYVSSVMILLFLFLVMLSLVYEWYSHKLDWTY